MFSYCFKYLPLICISALVGSTQAQTVTDYWDREIQLEQPARRIIALAPHIVENVYSAGAGEYLVAAVNYSDYPEPAKKLPQVGSYKSVNLERILALEPDLVVMWVSGTGEQAFQRLTQLGIPVYVDEPRKLPDVARSVRDIGALAGTQSIAEAAADGYLQRLQELQAEYAESEAISVFYQVWNQPLQTLNGQHIISDVIRLCGGYNIYADAVPMAPKINMESVLERDPQVIIASGMGEAKPEWLDDWLAWPKLSAVTHKNLYFVPPDLIQRHTLRILQGAELFCQHLAQARKRLSETEKGIAESD